MVSLFNSISTQYQDLRSVSSVAMMNTISRLVEDQIIKHELPVNFYAGFERFSNFPDQMRRYSRLGAACRRVYVFGVPDVQPPAISGIEFIAISPQSPLAREWFLLIDTPDFWTTLLTKEVDGRDEASGGRRFDGIWSFDEQVVARASLLISQTMETTYKPVTQRNMASQTRHISEINSQLVASLDTLKVTAQRRWRHIVMLQNLTEIGLQNRSLNELLNEAANLLHSMFGTHDVAITLSEHDQEHTIVGSVGDAVSLRGHVRLDRGPSSTAVSEGRLVQIEDMRRERDRDTCLPMAISMLAAPLIGLNRVHGVLAVGNAEAHTWNEEDGKTIVAFANMLMQIIERWRLQRVLHDVTRQHQLAQ